MEQRNYKRLKSNLDAQFITQSSNKYSCIIVDFCIHGMRLSVPEIKSVSEEIGIIAGQRIIIRYTANWSNQPRAFEVVGIVAQISDQEIGLKIPSFLPEAFQAIRSINAHQPLNTKANKNPVKTETIMSESFNLFQEMIDVATNKLFEKMDSRLQKAHDESMSIADQGIYKYATKFINENKLKIHSDLVKNVQNRVLPDENNINSKQSNLPLASLSLVSHSEIDDWIHVSSVSTQLNEKFNSELTDLGQRLANLVNKPVTDKDNPFSPSTLMESLRESLQANIKDIEKHNEIRNFFYEEFGELLKTDYPYFIQAIEKIIPATDQKPSRQKSKPNKSIILNNKDNEPSSINSHDQPSESATNILNFNKVMQALSSAAKLSEPNPANVQFKQTEETDLTSLASETASPWQTSGLMQRLHQLGKSILGLNHQANQTNEVHTQASRKDISQAIDKLSNINEQDSSIPLSDRIQDEINSESSELRLMSEKEREALDTVSLLYNKSIPAASKQTKITQLVKQLEKPLLKSALTDESLLQSKQHPARRVVDLIEQFSIATDSNGNILDKILQKNLDEVVENITTNYEQGGTAYLETAKHSLENLLDPLQKDRLIRISNFQEASEASAHRLDAHRKIAEYLEARFADNEIAELIDQLLREGWEQYLVMIVMRDGMSGAGWNQGEIAHERLMAWSEPSFKPGSKHRFEVSAWLAMVERHLSSICGDLERLKIFMAQARKSLEQTQTPICRPLSRVYIPPHRFISPDKTAQKIREKYSFLIDRLKIGEWWSFHENDAWIPMQLIWLSHPPSLCAFTNRSATEKLELTLDDFNHRLEDHSIQLSEDLDLPMLERAEYAIIDDTVRSIHHQATHSHIPGMWNRNGFMLNLTNISRDRRRIDQLHVLMVIGFDQIGMIYTQRGMEAGDTLIKKIADGFISQLRNEDIMAAFTESSFALLLLNVDQRYTQGVADKIMNEFKDYSFSYKDEIYSIGINIGLVTYIPSITSPEEGIRRADAAYNAASKLGRNTMQWYDTANAVLEEQQSLAKWAGRIDRMFQENRFFLRCQMIIPLSVDVPFLPRYEILLGINMEEMNIAENISASEFIPVLERLRRIHEIDLWVLSEFFTWINENEILIKSIDSFSINISALSLSNLDVLNLLHDQLAANKNIATKLFFEITETVAIEGYNAAQNFINQIRQYGCRFSIDDFGSGHSSYTHLKNLNTDELKIDGFFVKDIYQGNKDYAMVRSMNEIAHSLGMRTVAEHVDSIEAIKCLREIGVDYAQGYYLHEPMPLESLSLAAQVSFSSNKNL